MLDIAVSFAGEDRELVEEVVEGLKAKGLTVFYDSDYQVEAWGEDLVEYFDDVYRRRARYTIMFVSRHYADKMWTRHERRSALARGLEQERAYVLPVRLDDSPLEGLRPTVGYLDARRVGIEGVVKAAVTKVTPAAGAGPDVDNDRVPRTEAERQQLLALRPAGWEHIYFGAELLHAKDSVEDRYRDHRLRYAAPTHQVVTDDGIAGFIRAATDEAQRIVGTLMRLMDQQAQETAFGAPGEPGDADLIRHLAQRWNAIYEQLLLWAATLRGTTTPPEYGHAIDLLSQMVDHPIETYRSFVDDIVSQLDRAPAAIAAGQQFQLTMTLSLEIPDEVTTAFSQEVDRILQGR